MAVFILVLHTCTHSGSLKEARLFLYGGERRLGLRSKWSSRGGMGVGIKALWTASIWRLASPPRQACHISFASCSKTCPRPPHLFHSPGPPAASPFLLSVLAWSWGSGAAAERAQGAAALQSAGESSCC